MDNMPDGHSGNRKTSSSARRLNFQNRVARCGRTAIPRGILSLKLKVALYNLLTGRLVRMVK